MDSDLRWCVERKSLSDCVGSMVNHRIFAEATNMAKFFKGQKFLFLEGFISVMAEDPQNEAIKPWIKSLRSTLMQYGVVMWQMDDLDMLVYELVELDKKCGKDPQIYETIDDKYRGWNDGKKMVCKLMDVSDKKADVLIDYFGSPMNIFQAILDSEIEYTRTGNPKGIIGPIRELKGFSYKFIAKNKELLTKSAK